MPARWWISHGRGLSTMPPEWNEMPIIGAAPGLVGPPPLQVRTPGNRLLRPADSPRAPLRSRRRSRTSADRALRRCRPGPERHEAEVPVESQLAYGGRDHAHVVALFHRAGEQQPE